MRIRRKLSPEKQILVQKAIDKMMPQDSDPIVDNLDGYSMAPGASVWDCLQEIQKTLQHQDFMINEIYEEVRKRNARH